MITELNFHQEINDDWIRRSVTLIRPNFKDKVFWLEVPKRYAKWLTSDEDPLLILALFFIMTHGGECHIHAEIDRTLLENLTEHMRIWHIWNPAAYQCPRLIPDAIVDRKTRARRDEAICAFSGGVDASFALTSHHFGHWGDLSLKIPAAVMLHGADIFLPQQRDFDYAYGRAKESLEAYGIDLIPVRTNFRLYPYNWEFSHYSVIVATLALFGKRFRRGIMGSDNIASKEQIQFHIPYGMNHVTDHLLSSAVFNCQIVGSDISRTERCAYISQYPDIMKNLRVCWQAHAAGKNCGICEKCMRTALNFMAAGYQNALPFSEPFSIQGFKDTPFVGRIKLSALEEILAYNEQSHALSDEVEQAIRDKLERAEEEARLAATKAQIDKLSNARDAEEAHLNAIVSRVGKLAESRAEEEARLTATEARAKALSEGWAEEDARCTAARTRQEALLNAWAKEDSRHAAAQTRMEALSAAWEEEDSRYATARARQEALASAWAEENSRYTAARARQETLAAAWSEEDAHYAEAMAGIDKLIAARTVEEARLAAARAEVDKLAAARTVEEARLAATRAEVDKLTAARTLEEARLISAQTEEGLRFSSLRTQMEQLTERRLQEETRLSAAQAQVEKLATARAAEEARLTAARAEEEARLSSAWAQVEKLAAARATEEARYKAAVAAEEARRLALIRAAEEEKEQGSTLTLRVRIFRYKLMTYITRGARKLKYKQKRRALKDILRRRREAGNH